MERVRNNDTYRMEHRSISLVIQLEIKIRIDFLASIQIRMIFVGMLMFAENLNSRNKCPSSWFGEHSRRFYWG